MKMGMVVLPRFWDWFLQKKLVISMGFTRAIICGDQLALKYHLPAKCGEPASAYQTRPWSPTPQHELRDSDDASTVKT
jgi:hypothetical protein